MIVKELTVQEEVINGKLENFIEVKTKNDKGEKINCKLVIEPELTVDTTLNLLKEAEDQDIELSSFVTQFTNLGENPLSVLTFIAFNKEKIYTILSIFFKSPRFVFKNMSVFELGNVIFTCYKMYKSFLEEIGLAKTVEEE